MSSIKDGLLTVYMYHVKDRI